MTHIILYTCLILSSVTLNSLAVLLPTQTIEYRRADTYLQTRQNRSDERAYIAHVSLRFGGKVVRVLERKRDK